VVLRRRIITSFWRFFGRVDVCGFGSRNRVSPGWLPPGTNYQTPSVNALPNAMPNNQALVYFAPSPELSAFCILAFCGIAMAGYSRLRRRRK
jgi:hypothetical protein